MAEEAEMTEKLAIEMRGCRIERELKIIPFRPHAALPCRQRDDRRSGIVFDRGWWAMEREGRAGWRRINLAFVDEYRERHAECKSVEDARTTGWTRTQVEESWSVTPMIATRSSFLERN